MKTVYLLYICMIFACNDKLDVQQAYKFSVETMPVPSRIFEGETIEIRVELKREKQYRDTKYYIRFFQPNGKGTLKMNDITFTPNDRYPISNEIFRLYYTSRTTDQQTLDIYIEDSFQQVEKVTFNFTNYNKDENRH